MALMLQPVVKGRNEQPAAAVIDRQSVKASGTKET